MRGRPRKKPATVDLILVNRQDLALHSLWVPLAAAAEEMPAVRRHFSRGFPPPWDARFDGRGAAFMGAHARMVAAPDDDDQALSIGFPQCWTAMVRRRYTELSDGVDPTALLVMRLMCETPVSLLDTVMCHMAAHLVLGAQCRVREAARRCFYWMEWALCTHISAPAYDLGEMALWMWSMRYMQEGGRWERAIYHQLGLPYNNTDSNQMRAFSAIPSQIWPRTAGDVERTHLVNANYDEYTQGIMFGLAECVPTHATYYVITSMAMVCHALLEWVWGTREFAALAQLNTMWAFCARHVRSAHSEDAAQFVVGDVLLRSVERMPFGRHGVRRRQEALIKSMNCGFLWIEFLEEKMKER